MSPNPLVVVCSAAIVLIAMATVATSAPAPVDAKHQQQRQLDAKHDEQQQQQQPQQQQQQHNQKLQSEQLGIAPLVNSLLTSLLRQTLYTRMENLLLDGSSASSSSSRNSHFPSDYPSHPESVRKSGERRRIVDSAVRNYQEQDGGLSQDFTKLAGMSLELMLPET